MKLANGSKLRITDFELEANCELQTSSLSSNLSVQDDGPKGRPNNLPQPAWRLAELFFQSDLS
jgi:hypothetical protein